MPLPEDQWWNTIFPFQYAVTRSALLEGKRGVACKGSVCLFPVNKSKVVKGMIHTLALVGSPRIEDKPSSLVDPMYVTYTVHDASSILDLYTHLQRVSIDVRWVKKGSELEFIKTILMKVKDTISYLHFSNVPNSLERRLKRLPPKNSNVTFEFDDHPKMKGYGSYMFV